VLSTLLAGVTYGTYRTATFEEDARVAVDDVLDGYEGLERRSLTVAYEETVPVSGPSRVTVTVGHPPGRETPALASRLADRIETIDEPRLRADGPITVEVRYVAVDTGTSADRSAATAAVRSATRGVSAEHPRPGRRTTPSPATEPGRDSRRTSSSPAVSVTSPVSP
jgi:hypothetical protein